MNDAPSPATDAGTYYELVLSEGARRFVFRYADHGIRLGPGGLDWYAGGGKAEKRYADIDSINLSLGNVARSGEFGVCKITFRSGLELIVGSFNESGLPDPERSGEYERFVRDLHSRLSPADSKRIVFHAGETEGRMVALRIILAVAAAFFVLLPIGLFLFTRDLQALYLVGVGAFFVWPLVKTAQRNEPRQYWPDRLDSELFP